MFNENFSPGPYFQPQMRPMTEGKLWLDNGGHRKGTAKLLPMYKNSRMIWFLPTIVFIIGLLTYVICRDNIGLVNTLFHQAVLDSGQADA